LSRANRWKLPSRFKVEKLKYNSYIKGRIGWQNLRSEEFTDEGPFLITGMHFKGGSVDWSSCYHVTKERYAIDSDIHVKVGDVLITKDGSIGKLAYVDALPGPACLNSHLLIIRPRSGRSYVGRFLYYVLQSPNFSTFIQEEQTGTTFYGISQESIENFPAFFPREEEQHAIANFLDEETARIDELIAKKEQLTDLLHERQSALLSRAVLRGLEPNPTLRESGASMLGAIPTHWRVKPVKFVAEVGNGSTPNRDSPEYWADGSYPWLNSSVVNQEEVAEASEFVTPIALKECHLPKISPPAVLIGITGEGRTRGMATTLLFEATINQHLAYVKPHSSDVEVAYLRRAFDAAYAFLRNESGGGGSTKGAITCQQISNLKLPLPPLDEQLAICSYLDREHRASNSLLEGIHIAVERLREYRASLISAAVTGQIDVSTYRTEPEAVLEIA
jgi:type I restriction enzyme S subunit